MTFNAESLNQSKFNDLFIEICTFNVSFICLTETYRDSENSLHFSSYCHKKKNKKMESVELNNVNSTDLKIFCVKQDCEICGISSNLVIGYTIILSFYRKCRCFSCKYLRCFK